MATNPETVAYVLEQLEPLNVRARPMFGEFCVWCDEKVVALICDDTVYLKPTSTTDGQGLREANAYPGSRLFRVAGVDLVEDSDAFRALVQATADALPAPRPKKLRAPRISGGQ
jgi:DNA transformation protein